MMVLLLLGRLDYEQLTGLEQTDGRRREGRFLARLERFPGLFRQGMDMQEVQGLLLDSFGKVLHVEPAPNGGETSWEFIIGHLQNDHPVVISVRNESCGHWMVAVGVEFDDRQKVVRILALDSSAAASGICPWNAFIEARQKSKSQYSFNWHSDGTSCSVQIEDVVAIW
ncbi:hypothetical protein E5K00_14770 [Hymenobacter aquaticus]|uniref:Peptidase C39-like domain-containing protein n=2 Tax=Hymenobacter aquaticus TaxID=1867101 RepID=A0A4Z0PWC1_9BACT|nr:hypothetical protein E5K00_14770 [Hymenobacter aquaticus]